MSILGLLMSHCKSHKTHKTHKTHKLFLFLLQHNAQSTHNVNCERFPGWFADDVLYIYMLLGASMNLLLFSMPFKVLGLVMLMPSIILYWGYGQL